MPDRFSKINDFGAGNKKNFDFFFNQSFLPNPQSKKTSGFSDLDLEMPLKLDFSSNTSKSSEKFRPPSVDSFKKPEKVLNQLDFSIDMKKLKDNPKNSEADFSFLPKGFATEPAKAEKIFNFKNFESKAETVVNPPVEKPAATTNKKINNEVPVTKPDPPQKTLSFKNDEASSKAPVSLPIQSEEKKTEPETGKNSERSSMFNLKKNFETQAKRKNNTMSPAAKPKTNIFSSAKKIVRMTPAAKREGLTKEDSDFSEMMKKVGELRKSMESTEKLEFEDVILNEKDILKAEEKLPLVILKMLKLKNKQLECMNRIFSSSIPEIKDIISNYCHQFSS